MASWPSSTPTLKPTSASNSTDCGSARSDSTLAKPKPCTSPNTNATTHRRASTVGQMLFSAASTTDAAIADSTQRDGSATTCSVASVSVMECASVKAVTIFSTSMNALLKLGTGCQALL